VLPSSPGTPEALTVWDSSVLIPLILPRSKSTAIFSRLAAAGWVVAATPSIITEAREKLKTKEPLRKWLGLSDEDIAEFVDHILPALVRMYPGAMTAVGAVPADPDDDKVVAAAVESQSKYIVSEDHHLLSLRTYDGIRILSRDKFGVELDRLGVPK
jgi:putative PIN family toxin of toxin-antitoxin system